VTDPRGLDHLAAPKWGRGHKRQRYQLVGILLGTVAPDELVGRGTSSTPNIADRCTGLDGGPNRSTPRRPLPPIRDDPFGELIDLASAKLSEAGVICLSQVEGGNHGRYDAGVWRKRPRLLNSAAARAGHVPPAGLTTEVDS
jgi:hypothetical protein